MSEELQQARRTGEFPSTSSTVEDPQTIVEDYQHLQRLRDARGDPAIHPPPQQYNVIKVDIARRIKARDEMQGAPANFQEVDHRVQNWMSSINKEARMLEITQAALQRKGINNPTQDDLDAIAEEFMQIAERTLLDVANPLRMNATRMEGNMSRFDSQLDGFDGAMTAQIGTLNDVMTSQLSTLNTLNTMLGAQANTFNGSAGLLNTALTTVTTDLHQLTSNLPTMIATAVQAAVSEQLASLPLHSDLGLKASSNSEQPPGYANATRTHYQVTGEDFTFPLIQVSGQKYEKACVMGPQPTKSRFRKFLRVITGRGQSKNEAGSN
ncbi:hypothetical protein BDP67DRAFT_537043 [Colletotrichum lupini]|nr:hypothetical protein BDP67DRAFT_537043 [Colletotrichum lupini]